LAQGFGRHGSRRGADSPAMVKLAAILVLLAAGRLSSPVPDVFEWADPWAQQVRDLLKFQAETIADVALRSLATFGGGEGGGPYEGIAEADKKKVQEAFIPQCATTIEELADKIDHLASSRLPPDEHSSTLGHSMNAYIRVNCQYLPMDTEKCNALATDLQRLADAGHPLNPEELHKKEEGEKEGAEEKEAPKEEALLARSRRVSREDPVPEEKAEEGEAKAEGEKKEGKKSEEKKEPMKDGGEWCSAFFDAFFDGLVKAASEAAEEEGDAEGLLLMDKYSTKSHVMRQEGDIWAPMRSLLANEVREVTSMLRKKRVVTSAGLKGVRKAYEKAADADEAGVKKSFTPACATTLASVADNMLTNAGSRDAADYLGLSMSTHLQVQCSTTDFPLSEEECDVSATELYRLLDAGNPLVKPAPANATNGTAPEAAAEEPKEEEPKELLQLHRNATNITVHATGNDWCGDFFDRFFAGILENLKGEEKGEEAAELLLQRLRPVLRRAVVH